MELPRRLLDGKFYRNQMKGGRTPDTGRVTIQSKGGGHARNWRIVDKVRAPLLAEGEEVTKYKDRVLQIGYDPFRTGDLALVAGNYSNQTRLILAPDGLKVGDVIEGSRGPPVSQAILNPGDAFPLRFIPLGTVVHGMELVPGGGSVLCCAGGMGAAVSGVTEDKVTLYQVGRRSTTEKQNAKPTRRFELHPNCMATIGIVSNPGHRDFPLGKAGAARNMNRRPKGKQGQARRFENAKNKKQTPMVGKKHNPMIGDK